MVTELMYHKMKTGHQLGSYQLYEVSLSFFDDKRYILNDGLMVITKRESFKNILTLLISLIHVGTIFETFCLSKTFF